MTNSLLLKMAHRNSWFSHIKNGDFPTMDPKKTYHLRSAVHLTGSQALVQQGRWQVHRHQLLPRAHPAEFQKKTGDFIYLWWMDLCSGLGYEDRYKIFIYNIIYIYVCTHVYIYICHYRPTLKLMVDLYIRVEPAPVWLTKNHEDSIRRRWASSSCKRGPKYL